MYVIQTREQRIKSRALTAELNNVNVKNYTWRVHRYCSLIFDILTIIYNTSSQIRTATLLTWAANLQAYYLASFAN